MLIKALIHPAESNQVKRATKAVRQYMRPRIQDVDQLLDVD